MVVNLRLLAAGLAAPLLFGAVPGSAQEAGLPKINLSVSEAPIVNSAGKMVLRIRPGARELAVFGNTRGVIFDGDSSLERVRVTPFERDALWISCEYLAEAGGYCAAALARRDSEITETTTLFNGTGKRRTGQTRGFSFTKPSDGGTDEPVTPKPSYAAPQRGVPVCPGDPRCP